MNTRLATSLVIGALMLPVAGYAADIKAMKESVKENVGDAVITGKIKAEFAKDKLVKARNIKVDTDDKGVVTLSGNAGSKAEADKAVRIARNTKGVNSVRNDIQITPAATAAGGDQALADDLLRRHGQDPQSNRVTAGSVLAAGSICRLRRQ